MHSFGAPDSFQTYPINKKLVGTATVGSEECLGLFPSPLGRRTGLGSRGRIEISKGEIPGRLS